METNKEEMHEQKKVLDHGYVQEIESWGSDEQIIRSARMSTNKGFLGWGPDEHGQPGDERLLGYLYRNRHSTPFEFAGLTVEIKAPIFVFRQHHRHRTQSYNEMSGRYTPIPNDNYLPTLDRLLGQSGISTNKQASTAAGADGLTADTAAAWLDDLAKYYDAGEELYQRGLKIGVPKELARLPVTVARYSRMRASANLRNWLHFLGLRMDPHAQEEIRDYAESIASIIEVRFPRTYELFLEGMKSKK